VTYADDLVILCRRGKAAGDAEWKHYVEPQMQDKMLCEACYTQIKAWIDGEGLGWRT
jgi:hypothetical protein